MVYRGLPQDMEWHDGLRPGDNDDDDALAVTQPR